jgi:hypothetical protein
VESDDLVVNFDATETFVSDKRPFFTENQGIFEYTTPSDFSQMLYTRRIGGPADDGEGSGDITGALKLNGSVGATKYGVFAADEAEQAGRTFGALRLVRDFSTQNLGLMATYVDRPFLARTATVAGVDHNWRPTARWNIRTRAFGSHVEQAGQKSRDTGATVWADYEMDRGWRQQWIAMHFGNDLQINDAGYLARNSTNYLHWQVNRRFTDLPAKSRYASKDWRWRASSSYNDHGELLQHQFRMSRESRLRDGSYEYAQININSAGVDDLLTRGNGVLNLPPRANLFLDYERPRKGNWAFNAELEAYGGGLSGNRRIGYSIADLLHQRCLQRELEPVCQPHAGLAGVADRQPHRQFRRAGAGSRCGRQLDHHQPPGAAGQAAGHRAGRAVAPGVSGGAGRRSPRQHRRGG